MSRVDVLPQLSEHNVYCQKNGKGRFECAGSEIRCGDVVEVLIGNTWHTTTVRYDKSKECCKTADGVNLLGKRVKKLVSADYFRFKGRQ
tara:strand:+ start:6807 stop:7073 length:267 start_codon:yes stop_codon:yes gene_type:complete